MRIAPLLPAFVVALSLACSNRATVSPAERTAIVDSLTRQVKAAYDLSQPDVEQRLREVCTPHRAESFRRPRARS